MRKLLVIALSAACSSTAIALAPGIIPKSQPAPNIFVPNTTQDAGALPPKPADEVPKGALAVSWDRKSWITSIDRKTTGILYSLGSEHVIRGVNLSGFVAGRINSQRLLKGNTYQTVGSMLVLVRESPTELVVRVTQISSGKLPWSSSRTRQFSPRLRIRIAGGGRDIELRHDSTTRYVCSAGEPNCAP